MAVATSWYTDGWIVYQRYGDSVTLEDIREANRSLKQFNEIKGHNVPIHIIMDVRDVRHFPGSLYAINTVVETVHGYGWALVVGEQNGICWLAMLTCQLASLQSYRVKSHEAALQFIREIDPRIHQIVSSSS